MSIINSLSVALIIMSIVFAVLALLSLLLKVQSIIITSVSKSKDSNVGNTETVNNINIDQTHIEEEATTGELKLIDVDERTAAMVIAIVSDDLKVPLDELQFKSIRALD